MQYLNEVVLFVLDMRWTDTDLRLANNPPSTRVIFVRVISCHSRLTALCWSTEVLFTACHVVKSDTMIWAIKGSCALRIEVSIFYKDKQERKTGKEGRNWLIQYLPRLWFGNYREKSRSKIGKASAVEAMSMQWCLDSIRRSMWYWWQQDDLFLD